MRRIFLAEFIGTAALVFAGTGAILVNDLSGGAITHAGVALTFGLIPTHATLGATMPSGAWSQSFFLEVILTFLLMLVILSVSSGAREKGATAGLAIGAVVLLEAMFAGPICGASMNPARSLAPAVVSGHLEALWIYLAAPTLGALLAIPACQSVREPGCCRACA